MGRTRNGGGIECDDAWQEPVGDLAEDAGRPVHGGAVMLTGRGLGRGADAVVAHGLERATGRELALRFLRPRDSRAGALREAERVRAASNRPRTAGTQRAVGAWAEPFGNRWMPVVALSFAPGRTLHEVLAEHAPLGTDEVINLGIALARIADDLHRGRGGGEPLVHGDLGGHNIVLSGKGDEMRRRIVRPPALVLLDVGGASPIGQPATGAARLNRITFTNEQWLGLPLDARTDVAAIGRLLAVMLCDAVIPDGAFEPGHFGGPPLESLLRHGRNLNRLAAAELNRVVAAANADTPDGRQPSAAVLAKDLRAWLEQRPTSRTPWRPVVLMGLGVERMMGGVERRRRREVSVRRVTVG